MTLFVLKLKAEYFKTEYYVDESFTASGGIIDSQCECGAGMGSHAHCKRVCCALFASYKFAATGTVKLHETCTEKLQTFHQTKKFIWSPLKANNLKLQGEDEFTSVEFDPRPPHLRQSAGYSDFFQKHLLEFSGYIKYANFPVIYCCKYCRCGS